MPPYQTRLMMMIHASERSVDAMNKPLDSATPITLKRRLPHTSERPSRWLTVGPEGDAPAITLLAALAAARVRVGYLVDPPMDVAWWRGPLAYGWSLVQWHNAQDRRTAIYKAGDGVTTVELRLASSWFPDARDSGSCLLAWNRLRSLLREQFPGSVLFATPATTGLRLLEQSLPFAAEARTLPDHLREYLWALARQGRIERLAPPTPGAMLDQLWQYDARWMYAACVGHLPIGPVQDDNENEYAPHVPGVYEATARVPADWRHIGLLPADHGRFAPVDYPNRPGELVPTICTGAELELAIEQGWQVTIHSRLLWPESNRLPDVARSWIDKLKLARGRAQSYAAHGDVTAELAAGAIRQISLDTVGAWFRHETTRHGMLALADIARLPIGVTPHIEGDVVLWSLREPPDPSQERYSHPEWAAIVWGRCRARLARMALELPYDDIVALRTDAIWTRSRPVAPINPRNPAGPGSWRIKSVATFADGATWPTDEHALLDLMRAATGEAR